MPAENGSVTPQRGGGGDGRVDGVAALLEHLDTDGGGVDVGAGHRAAVADGDRDLLHRRGPGAGGPAAPTDTTAAVTARTVSFRTTGRRISTSSQGPSAQPMS
ncbi:hypothetical protein GCM10020295_15000 [Streptomyces cinereospinus]